MQASLPLSFPSAGAPVELLFNPENLAATDPPCGSLDSLLGTGNSVLFISTLLGLQLPGGWDFSRNV